MNYAYVIPNAQGDPNSFVADNTGVLGNVDKSVDAQLVISVDYSQLVPSATIQKCWFKVTPGGEPQLVIAGSMINSSATSISFYVIGGIAGYIYTITINAVLGTNDIRSDTLTVNVLGDSRKACTVIAPPPGIGVSTTGDGSITVNTSPRFFVSGTPPVGANVLDRWYDTTSGQMFDYITNGAYSYWTLDSSSGGGGGGGGGGGVGSTNIVTIDPIRPDGLATSFTLTAGTIPVTVLNPNTLFVSVDGVWQEPVVQYTAVDNFIQFAEAPRADSIIFMLWFS